MDQQTAQNTVSLQTSGQWHQTHNLTTHPPSHTQILLYRKLGVVRVFISNSGFTRLSSFYFGLGIVRDIIPLVIDSPTQKIIAKSEMRDFCVFDLSLMD